MIKKNIVKIFLSAILLITITGCSESTPTGEMVRNNITIINHLESLDFFYDFDMI
ncbi:MAG: hypothetical protein NC433_15985 [Clostridiales bacterium]|nr:hypothetical protein [Clostridiales bacterium]